MVRKGRSAVKCRKEAPVRCYRRSHFPVQTGHLKSIHAQPGHHGKRSSKSQLCESAPVPGDPAEPSGKHNQGRHGIRLLFSRSFFTIPFRWSPCDGRGGGKRREDASPECGDCQSVLRSGESSLSVTVYKRRDHLLLKDSVSSEILWRAVGSRFQWGERDVW